MDERIGSSWNRVAKESWARESSDTTFRGHGQAGAEFVSNRAIRRSDPAICSGFRDRGERI
jgi:hypothetical protein